MSARLSALVIKSTHRAPLPRRRHAHLPRARPGARAADRTTTACACRRAELSQPRAGFNPQRRDRLPGAAAREGRRVPAGHRRRLRACRRRRSSPTRSTRHADDLDAAAARHRRRGLRRGSDDNLTVQIVRIDASARAQARRDCTQQLPELPLPPLLEPRMTFDGYRIVRELHGSSRSHIYLAVDSDTDDAGRRSRRRRSTCAATRPTSSAS